MNRDEFRAECMSELWDFMSFDRGEMFSTIDRVYRRYTEEQDDPEGD